MKPTAWPDFEDVRGARLLVALSGGADSTALLAMLAGARKRLELHLAAAHVNHSIRGPESRADAEFCEKLCRELNVDFYLKNVDAPAAADASHEGIETVARRLRYDALREVRAQTRSDWIVLAHHRDDQAETVLMHLLRGCGGHGIGGMDKFSGDLYRPLLNVSKAELESFLLERGMRWREDSTNAVPDTPRNALRLNVLPLLEQSYPQAARAVARYAQIARCEDRLLDEDEMITWPDNNPEDWFYADMQDATNSHDYTWVTVSGDKVEKWTEKLEQRDWAALEHAWSTAHSAPGGEVTK